MASIPSSNPSSPSSPASAKARYLFPFVADVNHAKAQLATAQANVTELSDIVDTLTRDVNAANDAVTQAQSDYDLQPDGKTEATLHARKRRLRSLQTECREQRALLRTAKSQMDELTAKVDMLNALLAEEEKAWNQNSAAIGTANDPHLAASSAASDVTIMTPSDSANTAPTSLLKSPPVATYDTTTTSLLSSPSSVSTTRSATHVEAKHGKMIDEISQIDKVTLRHWSTTLAPTFSGRERESCATFLEIFFKRVERIGNLSDRLKGELLYGCLTKKAKSDADLHNGVDFGASKLAAWLKQRYAAGQETRFFDALHAYMNMSWRESKHSTISDMAFEFRQQIATLASLGRTIPAPAQAQDFVARLPARLRASMRVTIPNGDLSPANIGSLGLDRIIELAAIAEQHAAADAKQVSQCGQPILFTNLKSTRHPTRHRRGGQRRRHSERRPAWRRDDNGRYFETDRDGNEREVFPLHTKDRTKPCPGCQYDTTPQYCPRFHPPRSHGRRKQDQRRTVSSPTAEGMVHCVMSCSSHASRASNSKWLRSLTTNVGHATVLLDTGASLDIMTKDAARRLQLSVESESHVLTVVDGNLKHDLVAPMRLTRQEETWNARFIIVDSLRPGLDAILCAEASETLFPELFGQAPSLTVSPAIMTVAEPDSEAQPQPAPDSAEVQAIRHAYTAKLSLLQQETQGVMKTNPVILRRKHADGFIQRPRPYSQAQLNALRQFVKDALKKDWIEPVPNPDECRYCTNMSPVRKANGEYRWTQDLRGPNNLIEDAVYPLRDMEAVLEEIPSDTIWYSELDVEDAYFHVPLHPQSRDLTAFRVDGVLYWWKVIPQGGKTSPAAFAARMEQAFSDVKACDTFADNMLIVSSTIADHTETLDQVMRVMKTKNITPKAGKCHLLKRKLNYLIFTLSNGTYTLREDILQDIHRMARPKTQKEVRSFLGCANLLLRYVPDLAEQLRIFHPLLTAKRGSLQTIEWTDELEQAYQNLTSRMATPAPLGCFKNAANIEVYTDASETHISGVLIAQEKPIAYWSKALKGAATRYTIQDKELLAVYVMCMRFRRILLPRKVKFFNDNRNVVRLLQKGSSTSEHGDDISGRVARWLLRIGELDYEVKYVKSSRNPADWFSRQCRDEQTSREDIPKDEHAFFAALWEAENAWENANAWEANATAFPIAESHTIEPDPPLLISIPWKVETLREEQAKVSPLFIRALHQKYVGLHDHATGLFGGTRDADSEDFVPFIPETLLHQFITHVHEEIGHGGFEASCNMAKRLGYHPLLRTVCRHVVQSCNTCLERRSQPSRDHPWQSRVTQAQQPHDIWMLDFVQYGEEKYFLNIVDVFSGATMAHETRAESSEEAERVLRKLFQSAMPKQVHSDNAQHFKSKRLNEFLKKHKVERSFGLPRMPRHQGIVERINGVLKQKLENGVKLERAVWMYNTTKRQHHTWTPMEILMRRDVDMETVRAERRRAVERYIGVNQRHRATKRLEKMNTGWIIYVKNEDTKSKNKKRFDGPFVVLKNLLKTEGYIVARKIRTNRTTRIAQQRIKPGFRPIDIINDNDKVDAPENDTFDDDDSKHDDYEDDEYEVEEIVDHKIAKGHYFYLVKWIGYSASSNTWEPMENIRDHSLLHDYFTKIGPRTENN